MLSTDLSHVAVGMRALDARIAASAIPKSSRHPPLWAQVRPPRDGDAP